MKAYKEPRLKINLVKDNDLIVTSDMTVSEEDVEVQYAGRRTSSSWDEY